MHANATELKITTLNICVSVYFHEQVTQALHVKYLYFHVLVYRE